MGRRWVSALAWSLCALCSGPVVAEILLRPGVERQELSDEVLPAPLFTRISVDLRDVPLEEALSTIAGLGGFTLSYNRDRLSVRRQVSLSGRDMEALQALLQVLEMADAELLVTREGQLVVRPSTVELPKATLSGFVRSRADGESLPYATVAVVEQQLATQSNSEGYYAIKGIPSGRHVVTVFYIGYRVHRDTVSFTGGRDLRRDIELEQEAVQMKGVVVEAESGRVEEELRQLTSVVSLPIRDVKQMAAMAEPDLMRSLHLLPGVQSASDFSSGLYVRGGGPDQTGIFLDQMRLYNPSHAFGFFSTFNPEAIKDVTFYKGAYPARYGGSLGAVLDVQNRDGNRNDFSTSGGVSLVSSRLMTEGPVGNGSWMVAGRRTYIDPLLNKIQGANDELDDLGYHFYDINSKVNTQLTPNDNLMVSVYGGDDNLSVGVTEGADSLSFGLRWGNRALMGRLTHVFSPSVFGRLIALYSRYHSDITLNVFETPIAARNRVRDVTVKGDVDWFASAEHTLRSGVDLTLFRFDYGWRYDQWSDTLSVDPYLLSAYVQDEWQVTPLTEARLGMRGAYYEEGGRLSLNPRFSVSRTLQEGWRVKLAGGRYQQYLQLNAAEGFSGGDVWVPLDETVEPGRSWQVVSGLEWEPSVTYRVSVEAYYTDLANLVVIDEERAENVEQETSEDLFKTGGKGYATGLEVFVEKRRGALTGWLGYTLGWTRRQFAEIDGGRSFPPKYDRRHDLSLTGTYRFAPVCPTCGRWSVFVNFVYGTGQAFTPAAARYTLLDPGADEPVDRFLAARRNTGRLMPYRRLDVGVRRTLKLFGEGVDAEVYFQVFNVYNLQNEWFIEYDAEDSSKKPKVVKMLPIVPTFGLDFRF